MASFRGFLSFTYETSVHKDVTERLQKINPKLAGEARRVLEVNKSERHIRGGLATKEKYLTVSLKNSSRNLH